MLDAEQELWRRVLRGGAQLDEIRVPPGRGSPGTWSPPGRSLLGDAYTDSAFTRRSTGSQLVTRSVVAAPLGASPHSRRGGGAGPQGERLQRRRPRPGGGGGHANRGGAGQRAPLRGAAGAERGAAEGQVRPVQRAEGPGPPLRDREGGVHRGEAERPGGRAPRPGRPHARRHRGGHLPRGPRRIAGRALLQERGGREGRVPGDGEAEAGAGHRRSRRADRTDGAGGPSRGPPRAQSEHPGAPRRRAARCSRSPSWSRRGWWARSLS